MTHRAASQCVFATHYLLTPGKRGLPPSFPWHLFSRPTPYAVGRELGSFFLLDSAFIRSKSQYDND